MTPLNICFITREYAYPQMGKTGGIGVFLKQYTEQLQEHPFQITVFSFGPKAVRFMDGDVAVIKMKDLTGLFEPFKDFLRRIGMPGYITIKIVLEFMNRFYRSMYLSAYLWRHPMDVLEFHDYGGDAPYIISRVPKIIRCHGSAVTLNRFMGYTRRITDTIFEKHLFKRFPKNVIAVSEYSAAITKEGFQLQKSPTVIYNGVKALDLKHGFYLDSPTVPFSIFYFGSVRERKGIAIACRVFNEVLPIFPEATFHVMGNNNNDYWNTHALKLLSEEAIGKTTYYGAVPNDQVSGYLKKAHVVVFPSFGENFSIALLEVLALGKIVVTSAIPAFKEVINDGQNGFIADDEEGYSQIISSIFKSDKNLESISNSAVTTINKRFNADSIIKKNIQYYQHLLNIQ